MTLPLIARDWVVSGSSLMTVLRAMEEMSLSCSLSPTMLLQSVSTIVSTWYSLTLDTRGPRHLTAKFCTSPFLSSNSRSSIFTTFLSESSSSLMESCERRECFCHWHNVMSYYILKDNLTKWVIIRNCGRQTFCSSVMRSLAAMNLKSLSADVIWSKKKYDHWFKVFRVQRSPCQGDDRFGRRPRPTWCFVRQICSQSFTFRFLDPDFTNAIFL